MKLKHLRQLNEEEGSEAFNEFLEQLKVNCSEYYKQQLPLYRGMATYKGKYNVVPIRKDRQLRDMPVSKNIIFNHVFEKIHGIPFVRNQVAFVARDDREVVTYGDPYYVFPENNSLLIYNEDIRDSITGITFYPFNVYFSILSRINSEASTEIKTKGTIDDLFKLIESIPEEYFSSGIYDSKYSSKKEYIIKAHEAAIKNSENMIKNYKITKKIPSQNMIEIMVYGNNLYAIDDAFIDSNFEILYK